MTLPQLSIDDELLIRKQIRESGGKSSKARIEELLRIIRYLENSITVRDEKVIKLKAELAKVIQSPLWVDVDSCKRAVCL